jgi:hypothetical protein
MRSNSSARTSLLAATSLAAYKTFNVRTIRPEKYIGYLLKRRHRRLRRSHSRVKIPTKYISKVQGLLWIKCRDLPDQRRWRRRQKRTQDVHSWAQPLGQFLIAAMRFVKFLNLVSKHGKDGASRVARLQLRGKRMRGKIFLGPLFVRFQGSIENGLEV